VRLRRSGQTALCRACLTTALAATAFLILMADHAAAKTLSGGGLQFADTSGTYTVRQGDTLAAIAARTATTVSALASANGLKPPYVLQPGQKLLLNKTSKVKDKASTPAVGGTYTVAEGDTLSGIAARTGVNAAAIASANKLASADRIRVGQRLQIPSGAQAAAKNSAAATASGHYAVRAGDTLGGIARRSGVPVSAIADANGIRGPAYVIVAGQDIVIPRGGGGSAARAVSSKAKLSPGSYVVRPGDTVIGIARRAGLPARAIISANSLRAPAFMIRSGSTIRIPSTASVTKSSPASRGAPVAGGSYRVRSGDSVASIAARSGVPASAIISANGLRPPQFMIRDGQSLQIPGAGQTPATAKGVTRSTKAASPSTWLVRRGDTVSSIAKHTGVSVSAIIAANALVPPAFMIADGRTLVIPGPGTSTKGLAPPYEPSPKKGAAVVVPPGPGRHASREEVGRALERYANRYGLPVDLIKGLAWTESGWKQEAISNVGAVGVMQLMPGTADWIGEALLRRKLDRFDYEQNVEGGNAYLDWLLTQVGGDERLALASYYQGLGAVRRGGGPSAEGEKYIKLVQGSRKKFH